MFEIPRYKNPISLIPGGLPQLLDYEAPLEALSQLRYAFEEQAVDGNSGERRVQLHAFAKNVDGDFANVLDPAKISNSYDYEINVSKAIEPWLNEWLPLPFLRKRDQNWPGTDECRFEYGPSNWARGRLSIAPDNPEKLRLVLAFDMRVEEKTGDVYAALSPDDIDSNAHFALAWRFRDNGWFMDLPWVDEWLAQLWQAWKRKNGRANREDDWQLEYLARYLACLQTIDLATGNCEVYVIRPDSHACVNVDLVLDIGNSRTTGILVETQAQSVTNLNDGYLLQLRDMGRPENVNTDPFETRLEFSEALFGNDALSMRSGRRTPAFVWPSPARIGPEAARLSTLSRCEKGSTGMSSPKRYLWDERDWMRTWRFNTMLDDSPYVTRGPVAQQVNSSGTPLCVMGERLFLKTPALRNQERESAFESLFTRSSLMMFLLVEIIQQALMTINSPGQRLRRDLPARPRRLRQIIFTVPGGMPMAEQRIYRRWANWAVHVLWEALGWSEYYIPQGQKVPRSDDCDYRTSPIVRCNWDEATCTQLVFIYNEITRKFQGDALRFCELFGHEREFEDGKKPSVRLAAIDIGGGTTDLSITTFELEGGSGSTPRMVAHPEFQDGFNLAGDDILRAIVSEHVLEAIGAAMGEAGVPNPRNALATLFGRDTMDSSKEDANRRAQFVRQVAAPVALCLMNLYENASLRDNPEPVALKIGDCFVKNVQKDEDRAKSDVRERKVSGEHSFQLFPAPSPAALEYLDDYVRSHGNDKNFNVLDISIRVDFQQIDKSVRGVLRDILANLCEVIQLYACDALLLTGRPSRWPGIVDLVYSLVPLPPGRIFPMGNYRVGGWYPFSDALGNISDPKTTVVVGAILCALAEGQLEGFSFDAKKLGLFSTARHIGEMELDGQIKNSKVWFNVDPDKGTVEPPVREISFGGPMALGFRQLDSERWTTTRFYFLEFASEAARMENIDKLPLTVTLAFELPNDEPGDRDEGEFRILKVVGNDGEETRSHTLEMRLQTLPRNDGFWMDTGIIGGD